MNKRSVNAYYLITSFLLVTLYSASSPLYPMNFWCDANGSMTMGKALWRGIVLYRDVYEQRGPILYFIHSLAALISDQSFIGVWPFEVMAVFLFTVYASKIVWLYTDRWSVLTPVISWLILTSPSFSGDCPEEFCLPLTTITLFIVLRALKKEQLLTFRDGVCIGICSGIVLWMKFSMLGFWLGIALPVIVLYICKQYYSDILRVLAGVFVGVMLTSLPILVFYAYNGALGDLFTVYFYNNLNYYPFNPSLIYKVYFAVTGFIDTVVYNKVIWIVVLSGVIGMIHFEKNYWVTGTIVCSAAGMALTVYAGGMRFVYYGIIMMIYALFGLVWEVKLNLPGCRRIFSVCFAVVMCVLAGYKIVNNRTVNRSSYVQFRFADQMDEDSSLLNYQFIDGGFFTAAGIYPSVYYPYALNILTDEIRQEQNGYIAKGETQYIVSMTDLDDVDINHLYSKIDEYDGYFLYERKE